MIELLIVIVVLGILAAIVTFAVQNLGTSSTKATCQSDFKTAETAAEDYKAQMGAYPIGGGTMAANGSTVATASATDTDPNIPAALTAGSAPAGVNAAGSGGELLAGSNVATTSPFQDSNGATTSNLDSGTRFPVGPWLKDLPTNPGHYSIWVANDGTGDVAVLDSAGKVVAGTKGAFNDLTACQQVG
jgi:general secretion pathway protein G